MSTNLSRICSEFLQKCCKYRAMSCVIAKCFLQENYISACSRFFCLRFSHHSFSMRSCSLINFYFRCCKIISRSYWSLKSKPSSVIYLLIIKFFLLTIISQNKIKIIYFYKKRHSKFDWVLYCFISL